MVSAGFRTPAKSLNAVPVPNQVVSFFNKNALGNVLALEAIVEQGFEEEMSLTSCQETSLSLASCQEIVSSNHLLGKRTRDDSKKSLPLKGEESDSPQNLVEAVVKWRKVE